MFLLVIVICVYILFVCRWMEVLHTCSKAGGPMSRLIEHMPVVCMVSCLLAMTTCEILLKVGLNTINLAL